MAIVSDLRTPTSEQKPSLPSLPQTRVSIQQYALLILLTILALLIHGYHPGAEDSEIYVPGIKKLLNPSLYPVGQEFFQSHAQMTMFPNLIALSVRLTHLPLDVMLLFWHVISIFLLLLGCYLVSRQCFSSVCAQWSSVALVAALLTIPVAGTALYIMDEFLSPRSFSTPALVFAISNFLAKRYVRAYVWIAFTAAIHPLMALFGVVYLVILFVVREPRKMASMATFLLIPKFFPPVTPAYRATLNLHSYFFLSEWCWYEWIGIFAPIGLLWWFGRLARGRNEALEALSRSLLVYGICFFIAAVALTIPARFANLAELQPMRSLHLIYIFLFLCVGGVLGESILKNHVWLWVLLFGPLSIGMWYTQVELFSNTPHLEWPGQKPANDWLRAFAWIRQNTPQDAYFALDPEHMNAPGEDQQGFRAIAERSMMADDVKDSGVVSMFPNLAPEWLNQVVQRKDWKQFRLADFRRLKGKFGVSWVLLERPGVPGLTCPYSNGSLLVCRID